MRTQSIPRASRPSTRPSTRQVGGLTHAVAATAVALVLVAGSATPALANGVGDLYVATSAGVLEMHVTTSSVVNTIPVSPPPTALAFSPDGRQLYVVSDGAHVTPIEIETLDPGDAIAMPGDVTALAFPSGHVLVGAIPTHRTLVFINPSGSTVKETAELPGAGNLLAGDRHDPRVVVAEAGKSWLDVVDPSTETFRKATVAGEIQALAIERDRGGVLVATHNPDGVTRIDLTTLSVTWTITTPATPSAVTAMATTDIAAGGAQLWRVGPNTAAPWATASSEVMGLAASDEGKALHVAERDKIEVFDPDGKEVRTLAMSGKGLTAMAPVPAGSSLFTGKDSSGARQTSGPNGQPTSKSGAARSLPPTSTLGTDVQAMIEEPRAQLAATVFALVLALCWLAIHRYERRQRGK